MATWNRVKLYCIAYFAGAISMLIAQKVDGGFVVNLLIVWAVAIPGTIVFSVLFDRWLDEHKNA